MARTKRLRQQRIPGTEEPSIKQIDHAAEDYYEAVRDRLPYTLAEKEAKETLINTMVEHKQIRYEYESEGTIYVVNLLDTKNVRVKAKNTEGDAESNGDAS